MGCLLKNTSSVKNALGAESSLSKKGKSMLPLAAIEGLSHEDEMPENYEGEDRRAMPSGMQDIHRDLGRLEGRVGALENAMNKIETALNTIFSKLNEIKADIAEQKGEGTAKEKSNGNVWQFVYLALVPVAVAIITAYIVAGKH